MTFGLVSISDAEVLAGGNNGSRSMIIIVGPGLINPTVFEIALADIEDWADFQADLDSTGLNVSPIKLRMIEATEDAGENFSMLFLIFGSFVIFSGILLVMNIFVMLADERKSEMGMARAIGMQRNDLRVLFVQEGALLGMISSAFGSLVGVGVAWVLSAIYVCIIPRHVVMGCGIRLDIPKPIGGFRCGFLGDLVYPLVDLTLDQSTERCCGHQKHPDPLSGSCPGGLFSSLSSSVSPSIATSHSPS